MYTEELYHLKCYCQIQRSLTIY